VVENLGEVSLILLGLSLNLWKGNLLSRHIRLLLMRLTARLWEW